MPFQAIGNGFLDIPAAGTPVRITTNRAQSAARLAVHTLFIQQVEANTGKLYLFSTDGGILPASFSKTTGIGLVAVIPAPTLVSAVGTVLPWIAVTIPFAPGGLNAADYYLDADISGNDALISALIV